MTASKDNAVESGSVLRGRQAFEALPNNTHRNWWQDKGYVVKIWLIMFRAADRFTDCVGSPFSN